MIVNREMRRKWNLNFVFLFFFFFLLDRGADKTREGNTNRRPFSFGRGGN